MRRRLPALATTVALATVVAAAAAQAATVNLRVEAAGQPAPLFDGAVTTLPHPVDGGDGSGAHACSGPPGSTPAATATGALDDAMHSAGISWRGNWDPSFRDFFIDRIGPFASAAPDRYWSLTINDRFTSGGCLTPLESGDNVHFFYGSLFGEPAPSAPGEPGAAPGVRGGGGSVAAPISDPPAERVRRMAANAARYLRHERGGGASGGLGRLAHRGGTGSAWGRLALALRRGADAGPAAAALLGDRLDRQLGDGPKSRATGDKSAHRPDGSLGGDVNATALAVLALEGPQPAAAARAAKWLAAVQGPSGGFGYRPGVAPDVDSTGLATWALARAGRLAAARRGGAWVRSTQAEDGGFPSLPGGGSNSQSTGLALVALRVAGLGPRASSAGDATPLALLVSLARHDGSIAYAAGANPTPVWSTAQALLGLTSRAKLLGAPAGRN
jgi:hypothetical protein